MTTSLLGSREAAATQADEHDRGAQQAERDKREDCSIDHISAGQARGKDGAEQAEEHGFGGRGHRLRYRMLGAVLRRPAVCEQQPGNVDGEEAASVGNCCRGSDHARP